MPLLNVVPGQAGMGLAIAFLAIVVMLFFAVGIGIARWSRSYVRETSEIRADTAPGLSLWTLWVTTNALGFILADAMRLLVPFLTHGRDGLVLNSTSGLIVGLSQWLVLHRRASVHTLGWIGGTAVVFGLAPIAAGVAGLNWNRGWFFTSFGTAGIDFDLVSLLVGAPIFGMLVGMVQWLSLRQQPRGASWILANTVAFTLGFLAYPPLDFLGLDLLVIVPGLVGGVVVGMTTGLILVWLARRGEGSISRLVVDLANEAMARRLTR